MTCPSDAMADMYSAKPRAVAGSAALDWGSSPPIHPMSRFPVHYARRRDGSVAGIPQSLVVAPERPAVACGASGRD